jgi:hypothetical protein
VVAITSGAVGVSGAVLGTYISRTFIQSQESASSQMRQYFEHPVALARLLAAERLIDSLPEDQRPEPIKYVIGIMYGASPDALNEGAKNRRRER